MHLFLLSKNSKLKHDPVEYQIIRQKQSLNNDSIKSRFTICHSASFSSQVSITMEKNKLFKEEKFKVQNKYQLQ